MRNFIILSILFSGILLSCNGKKSREKLLNHIDTLSYLSEVLNDSIGVKFATNQVMSYNIYLEKSKYGKFLFDQLDSLNAQQLKLGREKLSILKKYGSNSYEYSLAELTYLSNEELISGYNENLESPNVYTGLINQISIVAIGNDAYQYNLTFDKDLNLIFLVKNYR
jgi:hypothetical protein